MHNPIKLVAGSIVAPQQDSLGFDPKGAFLPNVPMVPFLQVLRVPPTVQRCESGKPDTPNFSVKTAMEPCNVLLKV